MPAWEPDKSSPPDWELVDRIVGAIADHNRLYSSMRKAKNALTLMSQLQDVLRPIIRSGTESYSFMLQLSYHAVWNYEEKGEVRPDIMVHALMIQM